MPSNLSRGRLSKAFNEGRRAAFDKVGENPYQNPKLRLLWEKGRSEQLAGTLKTPIPPLEKGKTRARQPLPRGQKPPLRPAKRPFRPRDGGGGFGGGGFGRREGGGGFGPREGGGGGGFGNRPPRDGNRR
jgi:hypothetical protein